VSKMVRTDKMVMETFGSINELLVANEERPVPNDGRYCVGSSDKSASGWSGNVDYKGAERLFLDGWDGALDAIKSEFAKADAIAKRETREAVRMSQAKSGSSVSVSRALRGSTRPFNKHERINLPSKTLHITYITSVNCNTTSAEMTKAGAVMLSAVATLERLGYRVRLDVADGATDHGKGCLVRFTAKEYQQVLNLTKLSFPLAHAAFLRKITFRWIERVPNLNSKYSAYGQAPVDGNRHAHLIYDAVKDDGGVAIGFQTVKDAGFDTLTLLRKTGLYKG